MCKYANGLMKRSYAVLRFFSSAVNLRSSALGVPCSVLFKEN
jgi:hypothetical protein